MAVDFSISDRSFFETSEREYLENKIFSAIRGTAMLKIVIGATIATKAPTMISKSLMATCLILRCFTTPILMFMRDKARRIIAKLNYSIFHCVSAHAGTISVDQSSAALPLLKGYGVPKSSGNLGMFAAIRRASYLVSSLAADSSSLVRS